MLARLDSRLSALDRRLAAVSVRLRERPETQSRAGADAPAAPPPPATAQPAGDAAASVPPAVYLLFVPSPSGYRLVEVAGSAPTPGARVEPPDAPGRPFLVTKVAASPLPGDPRRCAYLQAW